MVVIETLWKTKEVAESITRSTSEGFIIEGQAFHVSPYNQRIILDLTTPPGKGSGILLGFLFQLRKWGLHVEKVDEWLEISPVHAPYYEITIRQKQTLERQIKEGLAGISSAVSDFELLWHDLRKYKEYMDYFEMIERGKKEKNPELISRGEQSLKSVFIDMVDVHTGEGIALKLIAPRWPTIISDFMKLTDKDIDPKEIATKYKVSEAEGVVLATKNKLFLEWIKMFRETVEDRYKRIKGLMEARKKSIDEYKTMLKPYITRYRAIRELGETPQGRRTLEAISWFRPAAHAISIDISTIWAWRGYHPPEFFKVPAEVYEEKKDIFKIDFPAEFKESLKIAFKNNPALAAKYGKISTSPTGIEPLDEWVLKLMPYIENYYKIKFTISDLLEAREKLFATLGGRRDPYFMVLEFTVSRTVIRMPDGSEIEDLFFEPFRAYMDTQNVVFLRILELKAKEKELENYISQMLGETVEKRGESVLIEDIVKEEYPTLLKGREKTEEIKKSTKKEKVLRYLIKPGPYETTFDDRVSGMYFREIADVIWRPALNYLKGSVGVPGFRTL
ncbi:MAG: hypothetical protein QXX38_00550 [Candidatus Aenigmatarchaeota archaeon]